MRPLERIRLALLSQRLHLNALNAGGVSTLTDLDRVKLLGKGRVDLTIGSALDLFGGDIAYADVVAWQRAEESE
jgi:phosphoribosylformimino-5-aminoimidazole carboxamide ribotide isomerase